MRKCFSAGVTPNGKQNLSSIASITPHPNTKADLKTPVLEKFLAEEEAERQGKAKLQAERLGKVNSYFSPSYRR